MHNSFEQKALGDTRHAKHEAVRATPNKQMTAFLVIAIQCLLLIGGVISAPAREVVSYSDPDVLSR
jgi:hypothetical protein